MRNLCRHTLRVRRRSSSSGSSIKKAIEAQKHLNGFLVEVAGLELAASSTRNWRATTCATPRFARCLRLWYYSTLHGVCQGFLGTKTWEFMKSEVFPIIPSPPRQDRRPPPRRSPPPGRSGNPLLPIAPPRRDWRGNRTPPARRGSECDPVGKYCSPRP